MPELLRQYDVLVLPSTWPEPFSRIVLQGMLAGLAVVATPAGGTAEVVTDGVNGLWFPPGDAQALAWQIVRLADDPGLRHQLAQAGRQTVLARFTQARMLDEIEHYLQGVTAPIAVGSETAAWHRS
jgi:glycosyltransferase involved in cell wall biosynthesis